MSEEIIVDGRNLKDMKVAELKNACKARNLPIGGNKATLVKRLQAAVELEGLKKSALSSDGAVQPNCNIDDNSAENDFVKQYLENQRKMLQKQHHRFSSASEAESEDDAPKKHPSEGKSSPLAETMSPPKPVMFSPKEVSKTQLNDDESDQEKSVTIQNSEADLKNSSDQCEVSVIEDKPNEVVDVVKPPVEDVSTAIDQNSESTVENEQAVVSPPQLSSKPNAEQVPFSPNEADALTPQNTEAVQIEPQEAVNSELPLENDIEPPVSHSEMSAETVSLQQEETDSKQSPVPHEVEKQVDKPHSNERIVDSAEEIELAKDDNDIPEVATETKPLIENSPESTEKDENVTVTDIAVTEDVTNDVVQMQEENDDDDDDGVIEPNEKADENKEDMDEAKDVEGVPVISMDTDVLMEEVEELDYDEVDLDKSENQEAKADENIHSGDYSDKKKRKHKEKRYKAASKHDQSPEPKKLRKLKRLSKDEVKTTQEEYANGSAKPADETSKDLPDNTETHVGKSEEIVAPKPPRRRISIKKSLNRSVPSDQPREKKRKWGKAAASDNSQINISTDSLKDIIEVKKDAIRDATVDLENSPSKPAEPSSNKQEESEEEEGEIVEEEVVMEEEVREEHEDGMEEIIHQDKRKVVASNSANEKPPSDKRSIKIHDRKSSSKKDHHVTEKVPSTKRPVRSPNRDVVPARMPITCVIHVSNLVRPFALSQLKQLLSEHGEFIPDSFWINNIKSHCFVTYDSEEVAVKTRNSLHNLEWPISSPKRLVVEYSTKEEVDWNKQEQPVASVKPAKKRKAEVDVNREAAPKKPAKQSDSKPVELEDRHEHREYKRNPSRQEKDEPKRGRDRERTPADHDRHHSSSRRDRSDMRRREEEHGSRRRSLREWDMHKLDQDEEVRKHRKPEPPSPDPRPRRREEPPKPPAEPPKVLEDLFRKTEATPCVYWLPLTEQQVIERDNEREKRRNDRAKLRREVDDEHDDGKKQDINKEEQGRRREVERPKEDKRREERPRESGSGRLARREEDTSRGRRKEPAEQRSRSDHRRREETLSGRRDVEAKSKMKKPASEEKPAKEFRRRKESSSSSSSDSSDSDSSSGTSDSESSSSSESESEEELPKKKTR